MVFRSPDHRISRSPDLFFPHPINYTEIALLKAGMAELADAADSKSAEVHPNSPSRHHKKFIPSAARNPYVHQSAALMRDRPFN
jgi:hypothetical protein